MKRQFYRVSVIGNCCWKIYNNRYFTGSHQHLNQGDFKKILTDNRCADIFLCADNDNAYR